MQTKLAENIRSFRKERALTQEQLSEVLGVTPGAVYKWEAGLSIPELDLILEMADFFDSSVDVLLGYQMKDNRLRQTVGRLKEYRRQKDRAGLTEAEKALKKYPHSFELVYESATLYRVFGLEDGNREFYRRALELMEQALPLLPQNTDPEISEQTLNGKMAEIYLGLDEWKKGVELLKMHNAGGLYNDVIGKVLADQEDKEEAVSFLSESLLKSLNALANTIIGYLNVYTARGDDASTQAILHWGIALFSGLRKGNKPNFFDKVTCGFLAALAWSQLQSGDSGEARRSLRKARELAAFFDEAPSYDESDIRFITRIEGASAHDDIGATALKAVANIIDGLDSEALNALWQEVNQEESQQ